jgi:hypothetical protein
MPTFASKCRSVLMPAGPPGTSIRTLHLCFFLALLLASIPGRPAFSETAPPAVSVESLERAIEETLRQPEYRWRWPLPKHQRPKEKNGWLASAAEWIGFVLSGAFEQIGRWVGQIFDWLDALLPQPSSSAERSNAEWRRPVQVGLLTLLLGLLALLVRQTVRIFRRRVSSGAGIECAPAGEKIPDVSDPALAADDFPSRRWLALAAKMNDRGDYRLAVRAYYLASLAVLAERGLLAIERYKSNRDYRRELRRKAPEAAFLQREFATCIRLFEQVWYGCRQTSIEICRRLAVNQKRITTLAEN